MFAMYVFAIFVKVVVLQGMEKYCFDITYVLIHFTVRFIINDDSAL